MRLHGWRRDINRELQVLFRYWIIVQPVTVGFEAAGGQKQHCRKNHKTVEAFCHGHVLFHDLADKRFDFAKYKIP